MKKSGITLVEMIVAMLLSTIIVSALACQFVAMVRFNTALQNTIEAERDAYTVVNNMTRILRFADPSSFTFSVPSGSWIGATIKGGHLSFVTADRNVWYGRSAPSSFWVYWAGDAAGTTLSNNVSSWNATYDSATQELSIAFSITKTSASGQTATIPISTKIKVRGNL